MHARFAVAYRGLEGPPDEVALPDGVTVIEVVDEDDPQLRAGLRRALGCISEGRADTLYLPRLGNAVHSFGELIRLLHWLEQARGDLVAADVGFDTASEAGHATLTLLREIERWEHQPDPRRRPRGRPGLVVESPALAQRIAALRERGLSLKAIADELNREGVPTPRGGADWRPSSVQSALGYRRPRPPVPGAPPPRPRGPGAPGPGPKPAPRPPPRQEHL